MARQLLIRGYILGYIQGCPQLSPPLTLSNAAVQLTLNAQNLTRSFGKLRVIHDLSLQLNQGEVLGLLGPNGAGKSTTLQMLTGCLLPDSGLIEICGINLHQKPVLAKAQLGFLPETPPLYREFSVDNYLTFAARLRGMKPDDISAALIEVKQRCGLEAAGKKIIATLSKGYQQRTGIAQAIIHQPAVIILDEPTAGLDPSQLRDIRHLIRELCQSSSILLSTHLLGEVESVCDRVQIMQHGRLIYSDSSTGMQHYGPVSGHLISLSRPPALSELVNIPGISKVEQLSATEFRILHARDTDTVNQLLSLAAQHDWQLQQLTPLHATLEENFVQITGGNIK